MSNHAYGSGMFAMKIKIPKKDSLGIITALYVKIFDFPFHKSKFIQILKKKIWITV